MIRWIISSVFFFLVAAFPAALAHEVRPAYLKVTEVSEASFDVSWKQPILDGRRLRLAPSFPSDCQTIKPERTITAADSLTKIWKISCPLTQGHIAFDGLEATLTDIFVQVDYLSRDPISAVVKPVDPKLDISVPSGSPAKAYLGIGVEHVAFGWDHLLFIIGLTLLVSRRQIIGVATAFTVAHSITLAITALGLIPVPSRPVEILIAASIVMLGDYWISSRPRVCRGTRQYWPAQRRRTSRAFAIQYWRRDWSNRRHSHNAVMAFHFGKNRKAC